jgi:glycosyltransferase involved in cell wall biosynthesis
VIYNGVRLQDFDDITPYVHPRPYILAIGRHVRQKGFDVLLRSFALLTSRRQTDHDLVLAGDGTERTQLEELANCLGVSKRVHFIGRVDRVAAAGLFCGCSYFVLPSRHEPLGIVNIEAMAAGKAVIATRVGGVPEIVQDGITGLLVDSDSIEPMADAMLKLCRDAGLRQRLGSCGAAQVSRFDWEVIAAEYLTVYHQVYSRAKTGARTLPGANHE